MRLDASPWGRRQLTADQKRLIRWAQPAEAIVGVSVGRGGWNAVVTYASRRVGASHNRASAWGAVSRALAAAIGTCRCGREPVRIGPYLICRSLACPVLVVGTAVTKGAAA